MNVTPINITPVNITPVNITPVKFYERPSVPPSMVNNGENARLAEAVKVKLARIIALLDGGDMVRDLMLPHIDSVVTNLLKQCDDL